jgi:4-aminobutyrate aminotransferase / (S)-3-amino-2-methylpropionate transaminase / 5-aminovalerate transaminase
MIDAFPRRTEPVPRINTRFRRIATNLPAPGSLGILKDLEDYEPLAMTGQAPVVWDRAEGFQVFDEHDNMWLDWSSGVLVANIGHSNPAVKQAIMEQVQHGLSFSYCFPTRVRANLARRLVEISPQGFDKAFFLTTGAEAVEAAIKLALTHVQQSDNDEKTVIVSFDRAFHGRTMGAQLAGGNPEAKTWLPNPDPGFVQVPFPDGFHCNDTDFNLFTQSLKTQGIKPHRVAAVLMETYQGGGASFAPTAYVQALRRWCDEHGALLIFDEIQSGFGRTGTLFGFEHYHTIPDMICLGKGISGSLPLSAVLGRKDIMDLYKPGSMTSTHGGNPVCSAAALANIDELLNNDIIPHAAHMGDLLKQGLEDIASDYGDFIGALHGKGMVYGLHVIRPDTQEPDQILACKVVELCYKKGLLMFAPVGCGGATIKICPPLIITEEAIKDGLEVLSSSFNEALQDERA